MAPNNENGVPVVTGDQEEDSRKETEVLVDGKKAAGSSKKASDNINLV